METMKCVYSSGKGSIHVTYFRGVDGEYKGKLIRKYIINYDGYNPRKSYSRKEAFWIYSRMASGKGVAHYT